MLTANRAGLPKALPGFGEINRYWDRTHNIPAAKILPGEYYVTENDEIITTVLGSCISACICDLIRGVGGMNHFMLPFSDGQGWGGADDIASTATRYGNFAMEHMINDLLKLGSRKDNLEVKIFGGGQIISGMSNIGLKNIDFVRRYVESEGLKLVGEDVGDIFPRKVLYYPLSGRVRVKKLKHMHNDTIIQREQTYRHDIEHEPVAGDIELF